MARLFVPAVLCPVCKYPNDHCFRFCQMCGYKRLVHHPVALTLKDVDLPALDARLSQLQMLSLGTPYAKQKSSLKSELEAFLYSLTGNKSLYTATPLDICRFLAWKDRSGKTQVHIHLCPHLGKKDILPCQCRLRLSYKTVDSYVGKLRAIFRSIGRQGDWDLTLSLGNSAASLPVKEYLKSVTAEQLQARVTPKQATPLFIDKLLLLSRHLERKMSSPSVTPTSLFVLARDQAFFKALFFSADRGNDLGLVQTQEILRFPHDDGFLFNHVWGKTLHDGASNMFGIRRHPNPSLCPVKAIETYFAVTTELGMTLRNGYLFRPTNAQGHVVNKPFTSSSAEARLRLYLKEADLDEGETLHSFRSGSAITLALSGAQLADVMDHVGWASNSTALYYLKLAQVLRPGGPSDILASQDEDYISLAANYTDLNSLKSFVSAFPVSSQHNPLKRGSPTL